MYFRKLTAPAFILILGMTSSLSVDAPSCEGCPKDENVCVIEAANATHPAQAHCLKVCPLIGVFCVECPPEYTCKAVGETCHNPRAKCVPDKALAH